jgi:hypothetical protein
MGTANVTITPPLEEVERRFEQIEVRAPEIVSQRFSVLAESGLAILVDEAPKRTGTYASRFYYYLFQTLGGTGIHYVLPEPLTTWFRQGTGIFGPTGQVIRPKRAKALHFQYKGTEVFAAWVRGMPPNLFLDRARERMSAELGIEARKIGSSIMGFIAGGE